MATSASLPDPRRGTEPRPFARLVTVVSRPEVVAILLLVVLTALRVHGTVDPDVSWQLWIADRVHHGARLYRDIIEVNPPLWFWLALPVDSLAHVMGARSDAVTIVAIAFATAMSLLGTTRLISHIHARRRAMLAAYAALILFGMPWMHIGQREQIVFIGAVPYAALIAARREGRQVPPSLAFLIGAGAALGFALKHYFLLAPACLELWLLLGKRRSWRIFRPEIVAMVTGGIVYASAMLIWARDFLTVSLPLIRLAYGATGAPHFTDLFQPPIWIALLITLFLAIHCRRLTAGAPLATALLIAGLGFGAAYFIQSKGWLYHSIPLVGCVSLALASLLAETEQPPSSLRLIGPALLVLPLATAAQEQRAETLPSPELIQSVADLAPGTSVGFLASEPAIAWSVTYQHQLRFASRYYGFWMLRAIVRNEQRAQPDPKLSALRKRIVHETVIDFQCAQPRRIIVSRPPPGGPTKGAFDILPFFVEDPEFAAFFAHYGEVRRGESLDLYDLQTPVEHPAASSCRRGV